MRQFITSAINIVHACKNNQNCQSKVFKASENGKCIFNIFVVTPYMLLSYSIIIPTTAHI